MGSRAFFRVLGLRGWAGRRVSVSDALRFFPEMGTAGTRGLPVVASVISGGFSPVEDGGEALLEKLSLDPLLDHLRGLGRLGLSILCGTREGCGISRSVCGISDVAGNGCSGHRDARFGAGERGGTHRRGLTLSHVYLARRDTSEVRCIEGYQTRVGVIFIRGSCGDALLKRAMSADDGFKG